MKQGDRSLGSKDLRFTREVSLVSDERELVRLFPIAAKKLAAIRGPIWSSYDSGADLARFVCGCRGQIARGTIELDQARELWRIFAPTCDWDDVVGDVRLGDTIFTLLDKLYGPRTETTA